ncbi:MAG: NADH:flavin oxidoreductase [Deltaproteobacteria bacterium]|nr:NADH:flavin oxidoreductase [Deltaproteobacteria bacterium]
MAGIFEPWNLGTLTLPNRLVRSATWEAMADPQGVPGYELANLLGELAAGQVGLIITGYAFVTPQGRGLPQQTGVHVDAMVGPLTRVSDAVHKEGGKIAMQIVHAGGQTRGKWINAQPAGPSAMVHPAYNEEVRELGREEIWDLVDAFAAAAARVKAAEFDAVELHGAHGYLLSQFLCPFTNSRSDDFGGSLANRARFAREVTRAVREVVGPNFPVFIKLNSEDAVPRGFTLDEAVQVAQWLVADGLDAVEVSGGVAFGGALSPSRVVKTPADEGYFLANARAIKQAIAKPVIVVGGFRRRAKVAEALASVDAVALSRPFIRQPDLAARWARGENLDATCISCGQCFTHSLKDGLVCVQELKKQRQEALGATD